MFVSKLRALDLLGRNDIVPSTCLPTCPIAQPISAFYRQILILYAEYDTIRSFFSFFFLFFVEVSGLNHSLSRSRLHFEVLS